MKYEFETHSGQIIEAALSVHRELVPGFLESVYESALKVALRHRGIVYESQPRVRIYFERQEVGEHRLDLIVEHQIVVELKAVKAFEDIHFATVKSYLKATPLSVGLLFNFNATKLVVKRIVPSDTAYSNPE